MKGSQEKEKNERHETEQDKHSTLRQISLMKMK